MQKRGQMTVFVIIGILLVIIIGIIFYLYGNKLKVQTEEEVKFDSSSIDSIKTFIQDCINKNSLDAVNLVGKHGGEIQPLFYQSWCYPETRTCDKISYLCYTTEYSSCYNKKPFLKDYAEKEIYNYMKSKLNNCIDLEKFRNSGFNIEKNGELKFNVSIGDYATIVNVNYPLTISKGDSSLKLDKFSKQIDVPLGRLIKNAESLVLLAQQNPSYNSFAEALIFASNGELEIERKIFDDTDIYITKLRNNPYKFQFAIQSFVRNI
jgi:hypothetical protein